MFIIGTAGHVDHGKSTLIRRITGMDPDRLAEEKAREMTIDLGFAWAKLPTGETIGFVDVPGHRDFVENMLSGITGIDVVLFVIAADEGIMPQTREHLSIVNLLGIKHGVIALTKLDVVDDPEWLLLIEQDIRSVVAHTTLQDAPIIRVSARTGEGVESLMQKISTLLTQASKRVDFHMPRLPVDRVFSIKGFGTVVTGSLAGGSLSIGDEIEFQPSNVRGRIRGLQSYGEDVRVAYPGNRVAVNVAGVEKAAVQRGDLLAYPDEYHPTMLLDVHYRHVPSASQNLSHNAEIKFFVGTTHAVGHVRLLQDEVMAPGSEGWIQVRLQRPVVAARNDRCIIRLPSPSETIGGGIVVDPHPPMKWQRFHPDVIQQLELRMHSTSLERIVEAASALHSVTRKDLAALEIPNAELDASIHEAIKIGTLTTLPDGTYWATRVIERESLRLVSILALFHSENLLRLGMSREELRVRLGLSQRQFALLIDINNDIIADQQTVRLATHQIRFDEKQSVLIDELKAKFAHAPYSPPSFSEARELVGENLLYALIEIGDIKRIQPEVLFARDIYDTMQQYVLTKLDTDGSVSAGELRDYFGTSRKYAIALLEYLDSNNVTRRSGDMRVKGSKAP